MGLSKTCPSIDVYVLRSLDALKSAPVRRDLPTRISLLCELFSFTSGGNECAMKKHYHEIGLLVNTSCSLPPRYNNPTVVYYLN
jgi:hypothetical protein